MQPPRQRQSKPAWLWPHLGGQRIALALLHELRDPHVGNIHHHH
jgi:hypothetical protein